MTDTIDLYSGPLSMFGMKAHIAILEKGIPHKLIMVPYSDAQGYYPKHPEVIRINPKQQVPVLIHADIELFDSTQIFEYLEDLKPKPALWPEPLNLKAKARQVELMADEVYFPHVVKLMGLQNDLQGEAALTAIDACQSYYVQMESQLGNGAFLVDQLSYADIAFFMAQLFGERMGAPITENTPNLLAWRLNMIARPSVRKALKPLIGFLHGENRPVPPDIDLPG